MLELYAAPNTQQGPFPDTCMRAAFCTAAWTLQLSPTGRQADIFAAACPAAAAPAHCDETCPYAVALVDHQTDGPAATGSVADTSEAAACPAAAPPPTKTGLYAVALMGGQADKPLLWVSPGSASPG